MFDWLIDPIAYIIFAPVWAIFVMVPFLILKYVILGIELIATALPKLLIFGTTTEITLDNLPTLFFRITIISVAIWLLLFLVVFIKFAFQSSEAGIQSIKVALQYSLLCWIYIALVPIGVFLLYMFLDWIMYLIGLNSTGSVGDMLFMLIKPDNVSVDDWQAIIDRSFFLWLSDYKKMGGYQATMSILFTTVMGLVISLGVLIAYVYASMTIMQKTFDQAFLFILSPIIATSSVLDGGKRMAQWRDMMISKSLVIFGIVLGSRIYVSLIDFVSDNISNITGAPSDPSILNNFLNIVVVALIALGGAFAFSEFGNLLSSFIGEGASLKEAKEQTKSMIASAATVATGAKAVGSISGKLINKTKIGRKITGKIKSIGERRISNRAEEEGLSGAEMDLGNLRNENIQASQFTNRQIKAMERNNFKATGKDASISNPTLHKQIQLHDFNEKYEKQLAKTAELRKKQLKEIDKNKQMYAAEKQKAIDNINQQFEESRKQIDTHWKKKIDALFTNDPEKGKTKK